MVSVQDCQESEVDMKKLLCVIAIFALTLTTNAHSACELRIGWEQWEPYQFKDSSGNFAGLDLEIVKTVLEESGCKTNFKGISWKRLLVSIENGSMDVAMGASEAV